MHATGSGSEQRGAPSASLEEATSLNHLAALLHDKGKYDKAQPLYERSLRIRETHLGEHHPDVASSLNNLANSLYHQGKHDVAKPLIERSLRIRETALGKHHPDVATSLNNLATLLHDQAKYDEAKSLHERSLRIRAIILGEHHPDVATSLDSLATLLHDQAKYDEAKLLYEQSLQIRETTLGVHHPDFATSLNNLATLLHDQAKYDEAKPLYEHSLHIRETILGEHHPDVATSISNLATLLHDQAKYDEAKPLYEQSLRIRETTLGEHHPDVTMSFNNLANLLCRKGKYDEAKSLYERSLRIRETTLGKHHPNVAISLNNLANLLYQQGKYDEAKVLYERSLRIQETNLGEHHPDVASSLNNLALLLFDQGKYNEAKPLYERSLSIRGSNFEEHHPDFATALNNLALLLYQQGKYNEAKPLYERSLRIREAVLGCNHPDVASSLNNLALLLRAQGKYDKAEPHLERSLRIRETNFGEHHPDVATSRNNLATLLHDQGKYDKAKLLIGRSYRTDVSDCDGQFLVNKKRKLTHELRNPGKVGKTKPINEEAFVGAHQPNVEHVAAVEIPTEAMKHSRASVQELEQPDSDVRQAPEYSPKATAQRAREYVQSLLDTDPSVRRVAIETLGKLPDAVAQHAEAIVQRLEDSDCTVRQAVARVFVSLDDGIVGAMVNAIAPLVKLLKSGTDRAKADAASALGCLTVNADNQVLMASAIPQLVELVKSGSNRGKQAAAFVLWKLAENNTSTRATIADAGAILPLFQLAKCGPDGVRGKAAKVLWSLAFSTYYKVSKARAAVLPPFVDPAVSGTEFADGVLADDTFLVILALMSGDVTALASIQPSIQSQLEDVTVDILHQLENGTVDNLQRLMLEKSRTLFLKAAVKNGVVPWRRTKLMIVGTGRAGKTCLLQRLMTDASPVRNQPSTVGVELHDLHDWRKVRKVGQEHLCGLSALLDPRDGAPVVSYSHQKSLQSDLELPNHAPKIVQELDTQLFQLAIASTETSPIDRAQRDHYAREQKGDEAGHDFETLKTTCDIGETVQKIKSEHVGMRMRVCDFGGQEVFHAVHEKFLTRNGVYVVVFNIVDLHSGGQEKTRALNKLEMWFHSIAIHAPDAPVFAVGTHRQSVPNANVQSMSTELEAIAVKARLKLRGPVPNEVFYAVDSIEDPSDAEVYGKLRKAIELAVMQDPQKYVHEKLPLAWLQTYDELQCARKEKRIYFTQISSVADLLQRIYDHRSTGNHRVSDGEIDRMLATFAKLGVVLHCGAAFGSQSEQLVFVDPQWLLDMFTVIIRDLRWHPMRCDMAACSGQTFLGEKMYEASLGAAMWEAYSQHGILHCKLLEALWPLNACHVGHEPEKEKAEQLRSMLLAVMESLKLIVKLPPTDHKADQDRYLVPSMLPLGTISSSTPMESDRIELDFLPAGLFGRLLAMLVACPGVRTDPRLIFRSTARFDLNSALTLSVFESRFENAIYLSPSGNMGKTIVNDALKELSSSFYSENVDVIDQRVVESLPPHEGVDVDEPVPMLMGDNEGNGGKPSVPWHKEEFDKLASQVVTKIQQGELTHFLTDYLSYNQTDAKNLVEIFSKRRYYSIERVSCLDDTEWEDLRRIDEELNAADKKIIMERLRSFKKRPKATTPVFALYITDSDETCNKLLEELKGLLSGFVMCFGLSRPPVLMKIHQADKWNALELGATLNNWLEAQPDAKEVVVHHAFHNRRMAIDAEYEITKVPCSKLTKRNHAFVINACGSYRSQDHSGVDQCSRFIIAWEGDIDVKTLRFFNEGFYAKFVHDHPGDSVSYTYFYKLEKLAHDNQKSDHIFVKSFACGINQARLYPAASEGAAVLIYGGRRIWRGRCARAQVSPIQRVANARIGAPCCEESQYADPIFHLGPLEGRTNGQGPQSLRVNDMRPEEEPVLCVITTRHAEYRAVKRRLRPAMGRGHHVISVDLEGVSTLVGRLGEYPAALFQTHMGKSATQDTLDTILLQLPYIRVVVAIGFGYGLDPALRDAPERRQMIGDVMVSKMCVDCSYLKSSNDAICSRGRVTPLPNDIAMPLTDIVFEEWSSQLKWENDGQRPRPPHVHFGTYLSGHTLIDDRDIANKFKNGAHHLKPIGGDMELFQIVNAVSNCKHKPHWLAIKGISDFAGLIEKTKDGQLLAAATAADFACYIFGRKSLLGPVFEESVAARDPRKAPSSIANKNDNAWSSKATATLLV